MRLKSTLAIFLGGAPLAVWAGLAALLSGGAKASSKRLQRGSRPLKAINSLTQVRI